MVPTIGFEPTTCRLQGGCTASCAKLAWWILQELHPHSLGYEPNALLIKLKIHERGSKGFEPSTFRLQVNCNADILPIELRAHGTPEKTRTPNFSVRNRMLIQLSYWRIYWCISQDLNLRPLGYRPNALPAELEMHWSG